MFDSVFNTPILHHNRMFDNFFDNDPFFNLNNSIFNDQESYLEKKIKKCDLYN